MIQRLFLATALTFSAWVPDVQAQPNSTPAQAPRRQRPMPVRSAEILEDGRVSFRLRADRATEVTVAGQWPDGQAAMTKGEDGVWQVTVGPVVPGVWEYSFRVDGITMIDPGNPAIKPMREPRTSILHVPGNPPLIYDFQDVPHGVIHAHTYRSKSLNSVRNLVVYTPPGYDAAADEKFPTLYLQHGMGDNQATWTEHGKAHWILDNLIAQGRAKPMVIVMMDGHAATPGAGDRQFAANTMNFQSDLLEDVMPYVESAYRVRADADGRAIVGLSMGGGQALTIGLNHTDRFAWVGGFSSAVPAADAIVDALEHVDTTNHRLKLLWIGCGKGDFLLERNQDFVGLLSSKNIRHQWQLTEGDHRWPVWRGYLAELAPQLFQ
jgi:enterochelin esterase family protein